MTQAMHLARQDVVRHWPLVLVWLAVVVAHPVMAFLPWPGLDTRLVTAPAVALVAARVVVGVVLMASIVQPDDPGDDRTFWRTRPIRPHVMAGAKLGLIGLVMVIAPLLVVLTVASLVRVPFSHWPSMVAQVLATDGALVGLVLVVTTQTRRLSTAIVATAGTVVSAFVLLVVASQAVRRLLPDGRPAPWSTDPDFALPTVLVVAVVVFWLMAALAWWGTRRRLQVLSLGLAGALAVLVVWFVPAARLHARTEPAPEIARVRLLPESVRAIQLPVTARAPSRVALVADFEAQGVARDDVRSITLAHGRLQTSLGTLDARRPQAPAAITWPPAAPTALLAVLSEPEFREIAGQGVRFTGQHGLDLMRHRILAAGALQPGTSLRAREGAVTVDDVRTPTSQDPTIAHGSLTTVLGAARTSRPLVLRLRDTRRGQTLRAFWGSTPGIWLTTFTMLPSFARPFEWRRMTLVGHEADVVRRVAPDAIGLELTEVAAASSAQVETTLDFTVPRLVEPIRFVRAAGGPGWHR